jgi:hypothetical protein
MEFYRIKIQSYITYSEKEYTTDNGGKVVEYNKLHKSWRRDIITFIRRNYQNVNVRDIINGTYKAISEKGYLIGVQFDMNKLKTN